jgi:hypothetical protein
MTRTIHDTMLPAFTAPTRAHGRRQAIPAIYADGTGQVHRIEPEQLELDGVLYTVTSTTAEAIRLRDQWGSMSTLCVPPTGQEYAHVKPTGHVRWYLRSVAEPSIFIGLGHRIPAIDRPTVTRRSESAAARVDGEHARARGVALLALEHVGVTGERAIAAVDAAMRTTT